LPFFPEEIIPYARQGDKSSRAKPHRRVVAIGWALLEVVAGAVGFDSQSIKGGMVSISELPLASPPNPQKHHVPIAPNIKVSATVHM
jgi:hypothetical protein